MSRPCSQDSVESNQGNHQPLTLQEMILGLRPLVVWMSNSLELLQFIQFQLPLILEWRLGKEQRERDSAEVENLGNELKGFYMNFSQSYEVHGTVHGGPTHDRFMYLVCLISSFVRTTSIPCAFSQWGDSGCSGGSHHADLPAVCLLRHKGEDPIHCFATKSSFLIAQVKTTTPLLCKTWLTCEM